MGMVHQSERERSELKEAKLIAEELGDSFFKGTADSRNGKKT